MTNSFVYNFMELISSFGDHALIVASVVLTFSAVFYFYSYKKEAFLVAAVLFSTLISEGLKLLFKLPRPDGAVYILNNPGDVYGFPSGHAMFYTVFFGFLIYLFVKLGKISKFLRYPGILVSIVLIAFVGISRVYLGVHYVHDVIGGYSFGLIVLFTLIFFHQNKGFSGLFNSKKES